MKKRPQSSSTQRSRESEELDSLNASVRLRRNAPQLIRRAIEADIEAKARKKRSREVPASAGFKRVV